MKSEIIYDMPAAEYHAIDALSASGAKMLLRSPAHYLAMKHKPMVASPAMKLGTVVHTLTLEPEKAALEIAVAPKFDLRTTIGKKAQAEFEADAGDKLVVAEDVFARAQAIAGAVRAHPLAMAELTGGRAEAVMRWTQHGAPCKARVDMLNGGRMSDIKTCQDSSPEGFARQIASFLYHLQNAHYESGFRAITGWDLDQFTFIAVESEAPFAVNLYTLDPRSRQSGRIQMERAAIGWHRMQQMVADGDLSGGFSRDIVEISIPNWAQVEPFSA